MMKLHSPFLLILAIKGPLNRHTNMFMDHMHKPWRTLAAIINKYLSGKTASNDKLIKYIIDILWGMFNRENVDYPELFWEDFVYQIDHMKEKRSRQEAEAARKVYATHARIVTESVPESAKKKSDGKSSKSVVIKDTLSAPKSKTATAKSKLKGAISLTPAEQEATNIIKPGVPDESIVISATSSEGTGAKPGVLDENKDITKEKVILKWGDEQDSKHSNDDAEKDEKDGDVDDKGDDHVSNKQDD
nr:hypothetical protein [Tanacetum cinerariifolium]